jgi:hypothetical protein
MLIETRDDHRAGLPCPALHPVLPCSRGRVGKPIFALPCKIAGQGRSGCRAGYRVKFSYPANLNIILYLTKKLSLKFCGRQHIKLHNRGRYRLIQSSPLIRARSGSLKEALMSGPLLYPN